MPPKNGSYINCLNCQKQFYTTPSQKKKFCSVVCRAKFFNPIIQSIRKKGKEIACFTCGNIKYFSKSHIKNKNYCSASCRSKEVIKGHGWKRKSSFKNNPYPRKQINKVRMKEHRRVMQEYLGRKLEKWEVVHHINENPCDNRIENLQLTNHSEHGKIHKRKD